MTLITLEGLDGSGKSTVCEKLQDRYRSKDILFTREPTQDTWYGDAVYRSIREEDANPFAELFLYMADHANHYFETIHPALGQGTPVICDRYIDSRIAYQTATLKQFAATEDTHDEEQTAAFIRSLHEYWSYFPDLTIYLDVSPETGVERSGSTNKFERKEHLQNVEEAYAIQLEHDSSRWEVVDAEQPEDAVFEEVCEIVDPLVGYLPSHKR